jgi:tRNA-specific 2-thiouridylase
VQVLVALSGGVDSSVAAALLLEAGHEVVGATMKLWGGETDSGCCSAGDAEDARRVAHRLGIEHLVFNFAEEFEEEVVRPYVEGYARGETPNPCAACNRHLKFDRLLRRAAALGFDALATGHHARVERDAAGRPRLLRGRDDRKDQSYVLSMLRRPTLERLLLPVGALTKAEVRARAAALGLATATKPDSQDVCFVPSTGRRAARARFLAERVPLTPARVVDGRSGALLGTIPAVELVTVGQRRGLGAALAGGSGRRFVVEVDRAGATVLVGGSEDLLVDELTLDERTWTDEALPPGSAVTVQASAHGPALPAETTPSGVRFSTPRRRVAPGQLVALYREEEVVGSGVAGR